MEKLRYLERDDFRVLVSVSCIFFHFLDFFQGVHLNIDG